MCVWGGEGGGGGFTLMEVLTLEFGDDEGSGGEGYIVNIDVNGGGHIMFVQGNAIMKAVIVASGGCFVIVKLLGCSKW